MTSPFWDVRQLAEYLGLAGLASWQEQVERRMRSGKIKAVKDGRRWLTRKEWVDESLAKQSRRNWR